MSKLSDMHITAPEPGEGALSGARIAALHAQIPTWTIVEREGVQRLERTFGFPDFASALAFTQDHHPRITTEWGEVTVAWWTHKVGGLHQNDFVSAAKTDEIYVTQTLSDMS
jgi:4a-hydroxytetrahydrobiopterin dehydratase